jgi:hypothetical protein
MIQGTLKAGVPQVSVLVPLLFLLFINDIADDIKSLVRLFADDSSLIYSSTNPLEVEDRLNLDLQVLDNWAKQWLKNSKGTRTDTCGTPAFNVPSQEIELFNKTCCFLSEI